MNTSLLIFTELQSLDVSKNVDKPSVTFSINNLDPFTLYEFKVRGATTEGSEDMWGELSNSVEIRTSPAGKFSWHNIHIFTWQNKVLKNGEIFNGKSVASLIILRTETFQSEFLCHQC